MSEYDDSSAQAVAPPPEQPPTAPSATDASPEPQKRGCRGCLKGCLITFGIFTLIALAFLGWFFNVPVRWGLVASPSEQLFSQSSNPWAEEAIEAELAEQGIEMQGIYVFVYPNDDGTGHLAYVMVDDAKGATWRWAESGYPSAAEGLLVLTAATNAAETYAVTRVAVDHRDADGVQAAIVTGPTSALREFADGTITREQLFEQLDGNADIAGVLAGMGG